jgi:hypothetical protein
MFTAIPSFMAPSFGAASLGSSAAGAGAALSGTGALAGAGGAAGGLAGLGAALGGPIGLAGLSLTLAGGFGQNYFGRQAADQARKQMEKDREYAFGSQLFAQEFPRYLDFKDTKREIALMNSPAYKQARGFEGRMDTFDKMAGKYGPAMARLTSGSFYG